MQVFVKDLQRKLNITTILVTHDKEEALSMADRIAIIIDGEIRQFASPYEIYEKPNSREVSDFFGKRNYIKGEIKKGKFICNFGIFNTNLNDKKDITFIFRQEEIIICDTKEENSVEGIIKCRDYSGDKMSYTIKYFDGEIYCTSQNNRKLNINDKVYIKFEFNDQTHFL